MRKILLALIIMLSLAASAQDKPVNWGIKAAVGVELPGKWHSDGHAVTMYRPGVGFSIGGVCNIFLGRSFYFEPGLALGYSQYRYKDLGFSGPEDLILETDPKIYKWSLQMPLVVGYTIDFSSNFALNLFTGPQLRYAFAGKIAFKNSILNEDPSEYTNLWNGQRRLDLAWKIGLGIPLRTIHLALEADLGLTNLQKTTFTHRESRLALTATHYF